MKITFNEEQLQQILAKYASETLKREITADDILNCDYEVDDAEDFIGVSIEFELPEKPE